MGQLRARYIKHSPLYITFRSEVKPLTIFLSMAKHSAVELSQIGNVSGPELAFSSLTYEVLHRDDNKKEVTKKVLNNVNGIIKPGTICAILGPSGGGKTTLLNALAGRTDPTRTSGTVLADGRVRTKRFIKEESGYVVQEDLLSGTLTVRENLNFCADLRLPRSMTKNEKRQRVEEVIELLGLQKCANQKIGTELIRGVSGGERRRTMIGMELVISPKILFLDEPTTGLDASTASQVMESLKKLAQTGRTIVMSIHQPRYRIYKDFDQLLVLAEGRIVYCGERERMLPYFENELGYICERNNNPPDFVLDVALRQLSRTGGKENKVPYIESDDDLEVISTGEHAPAAKSSAKVVQERGIRELKRLQRHQKWLADAFAGSEEAASIQRTLQTRMKAHLDDDGTERVISGLPQRSLVTEYKALANRTLKSVYRNPAVSVLQVFALVIFGLFIGLVYLQIPSTQSGMSDRVGAAFFIVMQMVFSNLSAIELLLKEKPMFLHEKASGYYSTLPYFICKLVYDIIPLRIVPVLPFAGISYWMMGFQANAGKFFQYTLTLSMTSITAASFCYLMSSVVNVFAVANLLTALAYVIFMLFGGLFVSTENVPVIFRWIKHVSIFNYPYENIVTVELDNQTFYCAPGEVAPGASCPIENGSTYLQLSGMSIDDYWKNIACLAGISAFCFTLTFFRLKTLKPRTA